MPKGTRLTLTYQKWQLGQFQYYTAGTHLLSAIITKATGKSMREFANQALFKTLARKSDTIILSGSSAGAGPKR